MSDLMPPDEWKKNLRLPKDDFHILVEMIRPHSKVRSSKIRRDVLSLEKRVAVTLYYLKDQGSMKMTANVFGIARCTVGQVVQEICTILTKKISSDLIKFPETKEEVSTTMSGFLQRFGFPQVIGCIDGTHIPIKQPKENVHDYFSYKQIYSINCQAICDSFGQFINVEVKWPGSLHDARVFSNCEVQKRFTNGSYDIFYKELLPGDECVPQLLIGDPAYPLLPYVMKEYDHCSTNKEVIFNQMLRSTRNQIECAFGRLKARWRILLRPMDIPVENLPNVIFACFVLHNFCERQKVEVEATLVESIMQEERFTATKVDPINSYTTTSGREVRDSITNYFNEYL